jgi:putative aldouronate transport system permease protein
MKKLINVSDFKKNRELLLITLPAIIFVFIFSYIPMGGLIIAFKNYKFSKGIFGSDWIGLENFKFLLTSDTSRIVRNTIGMNSLFIISETIVAITFALFLFEMSKSAIKVYQTIMFVPYFFSWVVVSYIFTGFFDMDLGFINGLLKDFGHQPIYWFNKPEYWPAILVFVRIWKSAGYGCIIYYSSLMGVDGEYYEAAKLDGANRWQQIKNISLPMLRPMIIIITILAVGKIFNADFGMFYFLTKDTGALYPTTDVIDTYVFRTFRVLGDTGMATAAGLVQSLVGFILVLTTNLFVRKIDKDSALF